jgi:hypothetical protein
VTESTPPDSVPPMTGLPTGPSSPGTEETERIRHLRGMLADLTGYIERRAEELATPLIESAGERAREMVAGAEREAQRWQDVNAELACRIGALQRRADENRDARDRLAEALGPNQHAGRLLPDLVTAAVAEILEARKQRKGNESA